MDDDGHIMIDEDEQTVTVGSQIGFFSLIFSNINLSNEYILNLTKQIILFFF